MKLLCTAIGHEFGDTTIERHREERERGTVLTVREYQSCQRCGIEEDIYKNEGVISTVSRDGDEGPEPPAEASADDGTENENERPTPVEGPAQEVDTARGEATDAASGKGDDAVIITETEARGQIDYEPVDTIDDGAVVVPNGSSDREGSRSAAGPTASTADGGTERGRHGRSNPRSGGSVGPPADTEPRYRCPECGFEVPAEPSPLHEGDICSNCHRGFIEYERIGRP